MSTPTPFTQGVMMCQTEDAHENYFAALRRLHELMESIDPDPALLDLAFSRANRAQAEWAALWEVDAA